MLARVRVTLLLGALAGALLLGLAACGGSSSSGMSGMPGMSHSSGGSGSGNGASSQGAGPSSPNTVTVTLSDFKIESSQTTFMTGTQYHFVVTNSQKSTTNHEFMLMQPMSGDNMNMGDMDKTALHYIDQSQLPPGATRNFDYTFTDPAPAGQLEFACHVGSHYQAGMHEGIVVEKM